MSEFTGLMNGTNELHPHFVVVFQPPEIPKLGDRIQTPFLMFKPR